MHVASSNFKIRKQFFFDAATIFNPLDRTGGAYSAPQTPSWWGGGWLPLHPRTPTSLDPSIGPRYSTLRASSISICSSENSCPAVRHYHYKAVYYKGYVRIAWCFSVPIWVFNYSLLSLLPFNGWLSVIERCESSKTLQLLVMLILKKILYPQRDFRITAKI